MTSKAATSWPGSNDFPAGEAKHEEVSSVGFKALKRGITDRREIRAQTFFYEERVARPRSHAFSFTGSPFVRTSEIIVPRDPNLHVRRNFEFDLRRRRRRRDHLADRARRW